MFGDELFTFNMGKEAVISGLGNHAASKELTSSPFLFENIRYTKT